MNGRCTADPLDHADDICDFCGDEFCGSCLIATRKGKGPLVCRECAINNSGIKGSRPTKPRVTKAQINKARATLADAKGTRTAKSFHFFDEEEGYVSPQIEISDQDESDGEEADDGRSGKRRFSLRRKHDDDPSPTGHDVTEAEDIADVVDNAPAGQPIDEPTPVDRAPSRPSTPATALIESGGLARLSAGDPACPTEATSVDDSDDIVDVAPTTVARATAPSLADRLRTPAAPPMSSQASAPAPPQNDGDAFTAPRAPALDLPSPADPTPATVTRWVSDPAPIPQPSAMDLDSDPFASPDFDLDEAVPHADVVAPPIDLSFPDPTEHTTTGASFEWQPSMAAADEDLSDDPFGTSPLPTPSIEPAGVPTPLSTVAARAAEGHGAHASSPGPVAVSDEPSADTDSNGHWIPPVLRGMAPVVERQADPLPRRRQQD